MIPEILFVDDEPDVLRGLKRALRSKRRSWSMRFASGGQEAISMLEEREAHVIVSDMRMPEKDGAALLEEAAERWPFMARVVLSGQAETQAVKRVVGISHQFLAKPCDTDHLTHVLEVLSAGMLLEQQSRVVAIQALPTPRATVEALRIALDESNGNANSPAKIIGDDIGLSAKLLQLSNSAYFGTGNGTLLPGDAVRTLGSDLLSSLSKGASKGFVDQISEDIPIYEEVRFLTELSRQLARLADDAIAAAPHTISNPILFRQVCKFLPLGRILGCLTGAKPEFDAQLGEFFMDLWGFPKALRDASSQVWAQETKNRDDEEGEEDEDQDDNEEESSRKTMMTEANVEKIAEFLQIKESPS